VFVLFCQEPKTGADAGYDRDNTEATSSHRLCPLRKSPLRSCPLLQPSAPPTYPGHRLPAFNGRRCRHSLVKERLLQLWSGAGDAAADRVTCAVVLVDFAAEAVPTCITSSGAA
jgi:hypothetical protein